MKIAILGGGITGLTSAYYLAKDGHQVTILEKEKVLGGLASGFKSKNWNWYLERAYHHLFANDYDILNFAKEIDFDKIYFRSPETSSLFGNEIRLRSSSFDGQAMKQSNNFSVYPLDTPLDLLKFPLLGFIDKLRAGLVILFLKLSPFLSMYKKMTSEEFLKKNMGIKVWNTLWQQLFRGKYGDYAENMRKKIAQQGLIYLFTGGGKGKTSAALGILLRALSHGLCRRRVSNIY